MDKHDAGQDENFHSALFLLLLSQKPPAIPQITFPSGDEVSI